VKHLLALRVVPLQVGTTFTGGGVMKWWQTVWMVAFGVWGAFLFFAVGSTVIEGPFDAESLAAVYWSCLLVFTLPAVGSYVGLALAARWLAAARTAMQGIYIHVGRRPV
jgi:hypothetical protein